MDALNGLDSLPPLPPLRPEWAPTHCVNLYEGNDPIPHVSFYVARVADLHVDVEDAPNDAGREYLLAPHEWNLVYRDDDDGSERTSVTPVWSYYQGRVEWSYSQSAGPLAGCRAELTPWAP